MRASASASSTSWVRQVIAQTTRELRVPCVYSAATRGRRSRSATAIRISRDARRKLLKAQERVASPGRTTASIKGPNQKSET